MISDMGMRHAFPKTPANYLRIVREFSRYLVRSPDTATVEGLRGYQLHLVDHGTSLVSLNSAIIRMKFFFEITLHEPQLTARMQPMRVLPHCPLCSAPIKSCGRSGNGQPQAPDGPLGRLCARRRVSEVVC
jgi:hypothetical protein